MRIKYQEHNTMTRPGLEPGPFDPECSKLTTRLQRLPLAAHAVRRHRGGEREEFVHSAGSRWKRNITDESSIKRWLLKSLRISFYHAYAVA